MTPGTRAILMYAESVKAGRKFMSAARAAARNKPVIVVKAGRAPDGARAAASHTGALAGSDVVFDAAVRRAGMLRVDTLEALFDAAETLAHPHPQRGERLAIVTNGGGAGVLAADAIALGGGKLAQLDEATMAALNQCLPATWSHGNPIDLIGDAPVQRYQDALRILLAAPEVDAALFIHAPTALVPAADIAAACLPLVERTQKPVLACWLGGPAVAAARGSWSAAGIACFSTPERAVAAWMQLVMHARNQLALQQIPPAASVDFTPQRERAQWLIDNALREGHEWLDEVQAKELLQAYGIPVVDTRRAHDAEEAVEQAMQIGFPVALKIISPQIIHKSDVGGVALNLSSERGGSSRRGEDAPAGGKTPAQRQRTRLRGAGDGAAARLSRTHRGLVQRSRIRSCDALRQRRHRRRVEQTARGGAAAAQLAAGARPDRAQPCLDLVAQLARPAGRQ